MDELMELADLKAARGRARKVRGGGNTLAEDIHTQLRGAILNGRFQPGERLSASALATQYSVSLTVVREALTRLSAENLVQAQPQQGFSVSQKSSKDLLELGALRTLIDTDALRRGIRRNDIAWQGRVLAAYHLFARTAEISNPDDPAAIEHTNALHRDFHCALVSGCGNSRLISLSKRLMEESEPFRRLSRSAIHYQRENGDEHDAIVQAIMAGDEDNAVDLLTAHYNNGLDFFYADEA